MPSEINNYESLKMNQLNQHIEALIFCSEQSISIDEIAGSLKISFDWDLDEETILKSLEEIKLKYASEDYPFGLEEISEGYQFLSKKEYHATISALIQHKSKKKLSVAQMETLSIIAYKQPITKSEVEHIRGVNCDYAIHKLLEKEMVSISGKSEGPGRPVLYSTSKNFMDYFGIQNPKDLPQLKDLHMEQNEIGISSEYGSEETAIQTEEIQAENSELENPVQLVEDPASELSESESILAQSDEREILTADTDLNVQMESSDDMHSVTEEEGIVLPDRKAIFIESQTIVSDNDLEEESSDDFTASDDSEIA